MITKDLYLSTLVHHILISILPFVGVTLLIILVSLGSIWQFVAIIYIFLTIFDLPRNEGVGRASDWLRKSVYMKSIAEYFSLRVKAISDIPTNRNYIIGIHPHGLIANGLLGCINKNSSDHKKLFGECDIKFATANYNLLLPLQRDYFLGLGAINASEKSMKRYLDCSQKGKFLVLVVGGAAEVFLTTPNEHKILLKKRRGFCRIALETGTSIIPAYTFGENNLWDIVKQQEGSMLKKVQDILLKYIGVAVPIVKGSAWWHYMFVMPKRLPLTVVHGRPIFVDRKENPSKEDVEELHKRYIEGVLHLFNSEKHKYLSNPEHVQLVIE